MAVNSGQGHPGDSLLGDLAEGIVLQQVGQHHTLVPDAVAQRQVSGNHHALGLYPSAEFPPVAEELISGVVALVVVIVVRVIAVGFIGVTFGAGYRKAANHIIDDGDKNKHKCSV